MQSANNIPAINKQTKTPPAPERLSESFSLDKGHLEHPHVNKNRGLCRTNTDQQLELFLYWSDNKSTWRERLKISQRVFFGLVSMNGKIRDYDLNSLALLQLILKMKQEKKKKMKCDLTQ